MEYTLAGWPLGLTAGCGFARGKVRASKIEGGQICGFRG